MKSIIITKSGLAYKVKIVKKENGPAHRLQVSVFKEGEKYPICGTVFNQKAPTEEIKEWVDKNIKDYLSQSNKFANFLNL